MDQVAEAAKQEDDEDADDNGMDGFLTEDEDDDEEGSDREMGDEADSVRFQKLAAQAKAFRSIEDDDDYSDDEELQSPMWIPSKASGVGRVAQHAEQRRAEIEKDKVNKAELAAS
ncbi:hypothetical protein IFM89_028183 [Coptis chinensis]|uniref:Uncharacterized protein n=1 Tax=Coptis chinensis TaxID=261450 RepID=A0A835HZ54_9MAGN|nr:hypothetical protein IFM89_028183 [Coptis chinensis]